VLGDGLTSHIEPLAQLSECLPIFPPQAVKELSAASIRQSLENSVISHLQTGNQSVPYIHPYITEPFGSLSSVLLSDQFTVCQAKALVMRVDIESLNPAQRPVANGSGRTGQKEFHGFVAS
jgi:hypothetical protein